LDSIALSSLGRPNVLPAAFARADTLLDHRLLELGKNTHHAEHGLARRRRRVQSLLMEEQVDLERVQFGQEADQVLDDSMFDVDQVVELVAELHAFVGVCSSLLRSEGKITLGVLST
jgi:hypothetical protein